MISSDYPIKTCSFCSKCTSTINEFFVLYDVQENTILADYYLVCCGLSLPHIRALAESIRRTLLDKGMKSRGMDGTVDSQWVVLDYGILIVHIMTPEMRRRYMLEALYDKRLVVYEGGEPIPEVSANEEEYPAEDDDDRPIHVWTGEDLDNVEDFDDEDEDEDMDSEEYPFADEEEEEFDDFDEDDEDDGEVDEEEDDEEGDEEDFEEYDDEYDQEAALNFDDEEPVDERENRDPEKGRAILDSLFQKDAPHPEKKGPSPLDDLFRK